MNSILKEWNDTNINEYLNDAYLYLTKSTSMPRMTLLLSCCAHIMHRVSTKVEKELPELKNNLGLVMELMALMIMTRNLTEMDRLFGYIVDIFFEKDRNNCQEYIKDLLKTKKIEKEETVKLFEDLKD